jgi:hypothetical protein
MIQSRLQILPHSMQLVSSLEKDLVHLLLIIDKNPIPAIMVNRFSFQAFDKEIITNIFSKTRINIAY